jgi:hypothetical protein
MDSHPENQEERDGGEPASRSFPEVMEQQMLELKPLLPDAARVEAQAMRAWITTKHLQCGLPAILAVALALWLMVSGQLQPVVAAAFIASVCLLWWSGIRYFGLPLKPTRGLYSPITSDEFDELVRVGKREPLVAAEMKRWAEQAAPLTYQFYQRAVSLDHVRWIERQNSSDSQANTPAEAPHNTSIEATLPIHIKLCCIGGAGLAAAGGSAAAGAFPLQSWPQWWLPLLILLSLTPLLWRTAWKLTKVPELNRAIALGYPLVAMVLTYLQLVHATEALLAGTGN